jgi:LPS sulfotransferase NodH
VLWNEHCVPLSLWTPIILAAQLEEVDDMILKRTISSLQPQRRELLAALAHKEPASRARQPVSTGVKPPQPRKLIIVVALQRSGTTAFCEALGKHEAITSFGEVFHSARSSEDTPLYENLHLVSDANFFDFREKLFHRYPTLSYPSPENVETTLDAFLDHLASMSKGWSLIDIKYNSWHHFETAWATPTRPPHLLKLLRARGATFIHIKRRDLLARYASEMIANKREIFHVKINVEPAHVLIDLSDDQVAANIREARSLIRQFEDWLAPNEVQITVDYENLLVNNTVSYDVIEWLRSATGLDFGAAPWPVHLKKVVESPMSLIRNWAEMQKKYQPTSSVSDKNILNPNSKISRFLDRSRADLRDNFVAAGEHKQYSYGRERDIDDHMQMLAREFTGTSSLLLYHAVINFLIRRSIDLQANITRFIELWENDRAFLLVNLDSRWLVSACDTIADHHPDATQRALAMAGTLFINTLRMYETERSLSAKNEAEASDIAATPSLSNRVALYDGLTAFAIGQGDAIQNLFRRIEKLGADDTTAGAILHELVARANSNDTVFARLRAVHRNPATMW